MATQNTSGQGRQGRNPLNNPKEGATTTKEGQKFVFKNGQWVKATPRTHARTGQGSKTAAKPAAKTNAKPDWRSKVTYNDPKTLSKQQDKTTNKPQPKPTPAATPKPSGGGSNRPATTSSSTGSKPSPQGSSSTAKPSSSRNVGPVANGSEYARNKDPKNLNPLMDKTFGYQKGDAPDQRAKRANYSGTDTGVSPKSTGSKNYADKKPANKTTAAYDSGVNLNPAKPASPNESNKKKPSESLAEAMRKRRTNT